MDVVIETDSQFDYLRQIGCDEVQGYLIGKPVPIDQIPDLFVQQLQDRTAILNAEPSAYRAVSSS